VREPEQNPQKRKPSKNEEKQEQKKPSKNEEKQKTPIPHKEKQEQKTGYWTEHQNTDMCGQGDVEFIQKWKSKHSIEDLKKNG